MFNIQRAVQIATVEIPGEDENSRADRLQRMASLKLSFVWHQESMIAKIDRAIAEAHQYAGNIKFCEDNGDFRDQAYHDRLNNLRHEFDNLTLWDNNGDHLMDVEPQQQYVVKYHHSHKNFHAFWEPVWQRDGYAASFFSEFMWAIHLPTALDVNTHPACAAHMQLIFQNVMHYAWVIVAFRVVEDVVLNVRHVISGVGLPIGRRVRPTDYFARIRDIISNQCNTLTFNDIPVRNTAVSSATKKQTRRNALASKDYVPAFRIVKARAQQFPQPHRRV